MLSRNLEQTLHKALALATEKGHEYATLEYLLMALTVDQDALAVLRACGVNVAEMQQQIESYLGKPILAISSIPRFPKPNRQPRSNVCCNVPPFMSSHQAVKR